MRFRAEKLAEVLKKLIEEGVEFIVIGDTVVQLELGREVLEGDVDLFVENPSPLTEQDFYNTLAEKHSWEVALTELGTPKIIAHVDGENVEIELYENFMDVEIPQELLESAVEISLGDIRVRALRPEHYFVLKARQGVDLDKLRRYLKELGGKGFSKKLVEDALRLFPEYEDKSIRERLRSIGLTI